MNRINEYGIEPGAYEHQRGGIYVVTDVISHSSVQDFKEHLVHLPDPFVVFRDVQAPVKDVNGRATAVHQVYSMPISKFNQQFKKL